MLIGLIIILLLYISLYDFFYKIIPNFLSALIMLVGFLYHYLLTGTAGLLDSSWGIVSGLVVSLFFYRLASLGAGDVKLFAAIGCFVGYKLVLVVIAYSYVLTALLGIVYIKLWMPWYQDKKQNPSDHPVKLLSQRIPMAPSISLATYYVLYRYFY